MDFFNRNVRGERGSVFNLIDVFNMISGERTKRLIAAAHSFTTVCLRVVVEKKRVLPVNSV